VNKFGADTIAQVDLGERVHRNRPLHELSPMAAQVLQAAMRRIQPGLVPDSFTLSPPDLDTHEITYAERPALATVDSYREKHPER
jgi:glucosyl-3-phosphoglycerate synthase